MNPRFAEFRNGWLDPETAPADQLVRHRAIVVLAVILGGLGSLRFSLDVWQADWVGSISLIPSLLVAPSALVVLWRTGSSRFAAHLVLLGVALTLAMHFLHGSHLYGNPVLYLPVLGGLMIGARGTWAWFGVALAMLTGLLLTYSLGINQPLDGVPAPEERWFDVSLVLFIITMVLSTFHSVQERVLKQVFEVTSDLRRENLERRRAEQTSRRFLATMSHELRTPLHGIVGSLDLMDAERLHPEERELLETVDKSSSLLLHLIDDVLDYSRLEAGVVQLEVLPVRLSALFDELRRVLSVQLQQKWTTLHLEVADDLPDIIQGDPTRLRQILLNLVGNAVKFTDGGEVWIRARRSGAGELLLEIEDTGIGISPESQQRLFQPFIQADATTTRRFGGSGLGLSIVARLVYLMEGRIEVRSVVGEGSCFSVYLPLRPLEVSPAAEAAPAARAAALPPLRILVVDDNAINLTLVVRMLKSDGHHVETATDGALALRRAFSGGLDLVLMDCQMPVMDGYEATRQIRALPAPMGQVTILGLSANALPEDRAEGLAAGMDDYLAKPLRRSQLIERVRQLQAPPRMAQHG